MWEGDDKSRILVFHEYPSHANHIEPDELAKTVCIHHLTDGFYNIPIIWGYGNHGGGPLPVMMDRIDELKRQTVFPNIKYSGFTEFYNVLKEKEDLSSLPVHKGELFLETHHKTYTVQGKTKYLNRECERQLLNAESLQAATNNYYNLDYAWEKQLFNQFHDVLAGTSLPQVYNDLYEDYEKIKFDKSAGAVCSLVLNGKEYCGGLIGSFKILEDIKSRDYDTWNFGFTGKEWDVKCDSFELVESGPVRAVFKGEYSFGIWQEKKPYYGTYLWHTPGVEYPTSFFTQYFIIYRNNPMIYCELYADWWEDRKVLKLSAQTNIENTRAFYQVPFGVLERPTGRKTSYEKARFEVPANTYGDLRNEEKGFAILNRSKHGYEAKDSLLRLTLLTSPYNSDKGKVPDSTADRGKHKIEYAFLPHNLESDLEDIAQAYERNVMILSGSEKPKIELGKSLIKYDSCDKKLLSIRLMPNGDILGRTLSKDKKIGLEIVEGKSED